MAYKTSSAAAIFAGLLTASCATAPEHIAAAYVSPVSYENYSCQQLADEGQRVADRAAVATGKQRKAATGDAVAMGVGMIVFWPALFFIKGKGTNEGELAHLKGEMDAIEQASIRKNCGVQFQHAS